MSSEVAGVRSVYFPIVISHLAISSTRSADEEFEDHLTDLPDDKWKTIYPPRVRMLKLRERQLQQENLLDSFVEWFDFTVLGQSM